MVSPWTVIPRMYWRRQRISAGGSASTGAAVISLSAAFWSATEDTGDSDKQESATDGEQKFGFKEKELAKLPKQSVDLPSPDLSHSFLVKQAALLATESSIVLLNRSVAAFLDLSEDQCRDLERLTGVYSMQNDNLPTIFTSQEAYNEMVVLKLRIRETDKRMSEIGMLIDYTNRLVETAVETAFLVGNTDLAAATSEQLRKLESVIENRRLRLQVLKCELTQTEAKHIQSTNENKSKLESSQSTTSQQYATDAVKPGEMKQLLEGLKKFEPAASGDNIRISSHQEETAESQESRFKFQDNSDDAIKISVKEQSEDTNDSETVPEESVDKDNSDDADNDEDLVGKEEVEHLTECQLSEDKICS